MPLKQECNRYQGNSKNVLESSSAFLPCKQKTQSPETLICSRLLPTDPGATCCRCSPFKKISSVFHHDELATHGFSMSVRSGTPLTGTADSRKRAMLQRICWFINRWNKVLFFHGNFPTRHVIQTPKPWKFYCQFLPDLKKQKNLQLLLQFDELQLRLILEHGRELLEKLRFWRILLVSSNIYSWFWSDLVCLLIDSRVFLVAM